MGCLLERSLRDTLPPKPRLLIHTIGRLVKPSCSQTPLIKIAKWPPVRLACRHCDRAGEEEEVAEAEEEVVKQPQRPAKPSLMTSLFCV